MTNTAKSTATLEIIHEESLRQWLWDAGGSLPGEFLRLQGLDPDVLVTQGLLCVAVGRWSDSYVAGPLLRFRPVNVQIRVVP